jgi:hypothetical protein
MSELLTDGIAAFKPQENNNPKSETAFHLGTKDYQL